MDNMDHLRQVEARNAPPKGSVVVVVASNDLAQYTRIKELLETQEFSSVGVLSSSDPLPVERLIKPSAFVLQIDPEPGLASEQISHLRLQDPDVPILFAVEQNSDQLEISIRQLGIQYYMLLPADTNELAIVVNSLARA
ncbi:MAG: hypothetical protein JW941_09050 [Candidatus Coatesbacteria bacterium]|nr:hypothetical protein [Candidatus Coatesbacteria bacterium]